VFGLGGAVRYVFDIGFLLTWLFSIVLIVSITGRQLPEEEKHGTIFPLLAKPIARWELLLGKWIGVWLASTVAVLCFYALLMAVVLARGGAVDWVTLLQAWILHIVFVGVLAAATLALSTRTSYGAAATLAYVLTAAAYIVVPRIPVLVTHADGIASRLLMVMYFGLPHLELFDMRQRVVHDWGSIEWTTLVMIVLYGLLVAALFLALAWLGYRNRRFKRGGVL
jgi:ABC-type transport system involved in multi-copper enzyme maturation permease subunit